MVRCLMTDKECASIHLWINHFVNRTWRLCSICFPDALSAGQRINACGLAMEVLQCALALRQPEPGLVHHWDRGRQYGSSNDQKRLKTHNIELSMSGKGNCDDNSMVKTMFRTIRSELIRRTGFMTRLEAKAAIGQYIDSFYNPQAATFGARL